MDTISDTYIMLIIGGSVAIILVVLLYLLQRRKHHGAVKAEILESTSGTAAGSPESSILDAKLLKAQLTPLRSNQPVFVHNVANLLQRAKKASDVKLIRSVSAQLEAQSDLLQKIDEYEEKFYSFDRKKQDFVRRDEITELSHERDKLKLLNEIDRLGDESGTKEKSRKRELENFEAELTHEYAKKRVENRLASIDDREKNAQKTRQFNDMRDVFNIEYEAIKNNKTLTPAVRKETLRTLERTFIAQLDEFTKGL
ncbi:MAG: hypothetical protein U9N55_00075 [candidate division Zixibacteria bacterium]|nr:hypothetical protein [candidate division Zixibacteria bacterium]